jgi:hypothetical protein
MSAEEFYFKVKPKTNAKVKAIASIDLPLYRQDALEWGAGNSIPDPSFPPRFVEDPSTGIQYGDGDFLPPGSAVDTSWPDPDVQSIGFGSPEQQFAYRYGNETIYSRNEVSFQTIYCEWDREKFANFIIESLVGKALAQALAYNYFGYPVANTSRRIDLNYDNDDNQSSYFGRMPLFGGSADPVFGIPEENLNMAGSAIGGFNTLNNNFGSIPASIAGDDPVDLGTNINIIYDTGDAPNAGGKNDDLYSRFYKMLGASRYSKTAFVSDDEFTKFYTNSHVYEIRGLPGELNIGLSSPSLKGTVTKAPGSEGVSGTKKDTNYKNQEYRDYEAGNCPDTNYYTIEKAYNNQTTANVELTNGSPFGFSAAYDKDKIYDNPFQPITKTHARLWMPGMKTAMKHNPLHTIMGGGIGIKTSKWYWDRITEEQLTNQSTEENDEDRLNANFKTANLVSMFKLVPANIPEDKKQYYLDNPHLTLNHILPKVLEYIIKVVPQNPRFAGPKPASQEPDTKTPQSQKMMIESPFVSEDPAEPSVNKLQLHRVMSGSFFEFQVGRKYSNAPVLARDPRKTIFLQGQQVKNYAYEKLGAQENIGDSTNGYQGDQYQDLLNAKTYPPQKNIDYATKFGLWNNDWIGGYAVKKWRKDGTYFTQTSPPASEISGIIKRPGGFMLLPRNPRTIESMISSLPGYGLGRQTISFFLEQGLDYETITKLVSDLWLAYHFATKPNGIGWGKSSGLNSFQPYIKAKAILPEWSKKTQFVFKVNESFDWKIQQLKNSGTGQKDTVGGDFKQNNYNDYKPILIYNQPDQGDFNSYYQSYQLYYAGYKRKSITDAVMDTYSFAEIGEKYFGASGHVQTKNLFTGGSLTQGEAAAKLKTALAYSGEGSNEFNLSKGVDVPVFVNRYSQIEFPIWNWRRGGDNYYSDLNDINWAPLIKDPTDNDAQIYADSSFDDWKKYIEQNPLLLEQKRKCIPDWVQMLRIYPTVKQDAAQYGFVPPNLPIGEQSFVFTTTKALQADASNSTGLNYNADQEQYSQKQFVIGEPGGGFNQGKSVELFQKEYFSDKSTDGFGEMTYKTTNVIEDACKPYMTLNFEWENDITSGDFRKYVNKRSVNLSYAVELEIDEAKLVVDLLKMGVVGFAGESEEYTELGMNLTELFQAAYYQGGSTLYSESLIKAYKSYAETTFSDGIGFDFSGFPTLGSGQVPKEAIQAALEAMPTINKKVEEAEAKYPQIESVEGIGSPITSYVWLKNNAPKIELLSRPGSGSRVLGYINNFTTVKVLKEWVNGVGDWNQIQVIDSDMGDLDLAIGYINPSNLEPVKDGIFFSTGISEGKGIYDKGSKILQLSQTEIKPMQDISRALAPSWWKLTEPFYHYEDGEYWINVELEGEDCVVDTTDLETKKQIAKRQGIRDLLDFYNKEYTEQDIDKLEQAYLVATVPDYHLDLRPGSNVRFLVKMGSIYLRAFNDDQKNLEQLRSQAPNQITLNQQYYVNHLSQALHGLNRMYLDIFASKYRLVGVDLLQEMKRLEFVPTIIKKILSVNGVDVSSTDDNIIEIGLSDEYKLVYVAYKLHDKQKFNLLNVGIDHFRNLNPINNTNTMSLFYHHRLLRSPMLKWQDAVKRYFINPKPQIVEKNIETADFPSATCQPFMFALPTWEDFLGPLAAELDKILDLDPRYDLGSFQFSLNKFYPPCPKPPSGVGDTLFVGEFDVNGERYAFKDLDALTALSKAWDGDAIKEYVGDWVGSAGAIEDIKDKVIDLDDLKEYVLDYIDVPTLYAKICKCFLDQIGIDTISAPNFEIDASAGSGAASINPNLATSLATGENKSSLETSIKGPKSSMNTDPVEIDAADLFCSFCFEIPSFFLRLPSTNILDILLDALRKLLEFILAQLLLELIKALLDILLTCPEITCPEGEKKVQDFGAQDLGNIFSENLEAPDIDNYFSECGLLIDGTSVTGDQVIELMTKISKRLSSGEVLGLIGTNITKQVLEVAKQEISKYPEIAIQLNNESRIVDFFNCAGLGLPRQVIADIENDIIDKYDNPEVCDNLLADAKKQLADRCGTSDLFDASADRALNFDLDKYKALADAIRKNQNLSNELPPIFGDCNGNLGVLSGLPNPTMDHVIEKTIDQIITPIRTTMKNDLDTFKRNLVSKNPVTEELVNASLPTALFNLLTFADNKRQDLLYPAKFENAVFMPTNSSLLASGPILQGGSVRGIEIKKEVDGKELVGIDDVLQNLEEDITINKGSATEIASLDIKVDDASVTLEMFPPTQDPNGTPIYEDNYQLSVKVKNMFGAKNQQQTIVLDKKTGNQKKLSDELTAYLEQFPLDANSPYSVQAQYFSQALLSKLKNKDFELSSENEAKFKDIFADDIYWSVWTSVVDTVAESISNSELLQEYELDKTDDFLAGFNPLFIMPTIAVVFAYIELGAIAAGYPGATDEFIETLYNGDYFRKEMTHFNLAPYGNETGLVDFPKIKKIVKDNYDFSRFHDPESDQMGMPHFAILQGLIAAFSQIFVGEMYLRSIISLSKLPIQILIQDDSMIELAFRNMMDYIESGPSDFEKNIQEAVEGIFLQCSSGRISYAPENPDLGGIPGTAKLLTQSGEKDYKIDSWKDGLKYLMRLEIESPIPFIQKKLNAFKTKGTDQEISKINPVAAISYKNMLSVPNTVFPSEGLDQNSLAAPGRFSQAKD